MISFDQNPAYFAFASAVLGATFEHGPDCKVTTKLHEDGSIAAVVLYTRFSRHNLEMSIASDGSTTWLNRKFIRAVFAYPFLVLEKRRVTVVTSENNRRVLQQAERLGFTREAQLRGWYGNEDGILFGMLREECAWLKGK